MEKKYNPHELQLVKGNNLEIVLRSDIGTKYFRGFSDHCHVYSLFSFKNYSTVSLQTLYSLQ
ncbi:hypothetical protein ALE3EI_0774 [Constantimarinum furrinae]|uniref:Uncharacterized protein n=1 Tax=Constantimarinum furrinae TaxID=2562285 RepID=A0A7G8PSN4_9FLAO|nr:hypothetical protein ALE3EI_0774 [Constantimarinum furrinae]